MIMIQIQLKFLAEEMQAISKGLEKVIQELSTSENDGPISENFRKVIRHQFLLSLYSTTLHIPNVTNHVNRKKLDYVPMNDV